jgi:heat shock protein 4
MAQQDRVIQETADKRNELEAYIYGMRDKLDGSMRPFATDQERAEMTALLGSAEEWLYSDEGFDNVKSVYSKKLGDLRNKGDPLDARALEAEQRPEAVSEIQAYIERCKSFVSSNVRNTFAVHALIELNWIACIG